MRCAAVSTGAHSCPEDAGSVSAFLLWGGHALELSWCEHRILQKYTSAKNYVNLIFLCYQTVVFLHVIPVVFYKTPGGNDKVLQYRIA